MNKEKRNKIKKRIRNVVKGTKDRPRLNVFKSNNNIYAQLIDDTKNVTLIGVSTKSLKKDKKLSKIEEAKELGQKLAESAIAKKIKVVVFDRGGYRYHGRVKAVAEGAREKGLKI